MKIKYFILAGALLSATATLPLPYVQNTLMQSAQAASMKEQSQLPALLGMPKGSKIRTSGLANGTMLFAQSSAQSISMEQDITLNSFARKAIEQLVERKLSSPTNNVKFRFDVKKTNKGFTYHLFDRGNNQLLIEGPVKVFLGANTATHQEVEFKAPIARMKVVVKKASAGASQINGTATFGIGPIPVPGSLSFHLYK